MSNNQKKSKPFSWKERAKSFDYSFQGIVQFFKEEHNARIHLAMAIIVIFLSCYFSISPIEWMVIILCIMIVLVAEMMNTAIEKLCDVAHPEKHPLIKSCKDIASGAVLVSAVGSIVVACFIFVPRIWAVL